MSIGPTTSIYYKNRDFLFVFCFLVLFCFVFSFSLPFLDLQAFKVCHFTNAYTFTNDCTIWIRVCYELGPWFEWAFQLIFSHHICYSFSAKWKVYIRIYRPTKKETVKNRFFLIGKAIKFAPANVVGGYTMFRLVHTAAITHTTCVQKLAVLFWKV